MVKTTSSGFDSPTIQQRRVKTTVVVNDGEVLALGGMIQEQASEDQQPDPAARRHTRARRRVLQPGDQSRKTELVILITPRVVRDGTESRLVTEEYRRKMPDVYMPHTTSRERTPANTMQRIISQ